MSGSRTNHIVGGTPTLVEKTSPTTEEAGASLLLAKGRNRVCTKHIQAAQLRSWREVYRILLKNSRLPSAKKIVQAAQNEWLRKPDHKLYNLLDHQHFYELPSPRSTNESIVCYQFAFNGANPPKLGLRNQKLAPSSPYEHLLRNPCPLFMKTYSPGEDEMTYEQS
jgi:hypothetical protein